MAATKHLPPSSQVSKRLSSTASLKSRTKATKAQPKPKPTVKTGTKSAHFTSTTTSTTSKPHSAESAWSQNRTHIPTPYQSRVYAHLLTIPSGRITTYAALSRALNSSPRAVGGALRTNPFAPQVPCHRVIASSGYVGGFIGEWEKAPSGFNQNLKLELLREEGVEFDERGRLVSDGGVWFDGPWDTSETVAEVERRVEEQARKKAEAGAEMDG